ncbi:hypothetical protein FQA39_LY02744 [Lamprigera yunnana]|nr:hypothetical protein FQA39_LY02744 [Lamprigera yunnana]
MEMFMKVEDGVNAAPTHRIITTKALAYAFLGIFQVDSLPNTAALNAVKLLMSCGVQKGYIISNYKLVAHRQVRATSCPGEALFREISTWDNWISKP